MRFNRAVTKAADFALAITFLAILLASTGALGGLF